MGVIAEEDGVLKLVHPGRYVEIHKKPVLAAEVLKKNPRHCITRPDVFKNPSIVVSPDSVLNPGKVFFIVPNITLYGLLKARGLHKQHAQQQCQLHRYAGMTGMHQSQNRCLKHLWRMSWNEESSLIHEYNKQQLRRISWNYDSNNTAEMRTKIDNDLEFDCIKEATTIHFCSRKPEEATTLKSCLRKPESMRKSLPHRVSFVLPNKDDQRQRRLPGSQSQT